MLQRELNTTACVDLRALFNRVSKKFRQITLVLIVRFETGLVIYNFFQLSAVKPKLNQSLANKTNHPISKRLDYSANLERS